MSTHKPASNSPRQASCSLTQPNLAGEMSFMSLKDLHDSMKISPLEDSMKYDPYVGTFLSGLGVDYVLSKFVEANIDMETFLTMTEEDLIAIGVPLSNTRTKILNGIKKLHLRKWNGDSMPLSLVDADVFTMADSVKIMANLTKHLQFLLATVVYMTRQVKKGPVLLPMEEDIQYSEVLLVSNKKAQILAEMMELELQELHGNILNLREKDDFVEPDLITAWMPRHHRKQHRRGSSLAYWLAATVIGGVTLALWKLRHRGVAFVLPKLW